MAADGTETPAVLTIRKLDEALHDSSAFSCGHQPIDEFLKSSIAERAKEGKLVAWIATLPNKREILGFYTLAAMAVRAVYGPPEWRTDPTPEVPVIYLRTVAVHNEYQRSGYGTALIVHAMRKSLKIADSMGAAAIVLDVLPGPGLEKRLAFFETLGFHDLHDPDNPTRMYISLADVRATLLPVS